MIDPKKVTSFLNNYFDELKNFLNANKSKGSLTFEEVGRIFDSVEITGKAEAYQFIEERIDGTYVMRDLHQNYIEGILDDYTLDMPEQISKYYYSLSQLYNKLLVCTEKNETLSLINSLGSEIQNFEWQLKRNVRGLIKETKKIKANNENYTYRQKLRKATDLSRVYLEPLITILSDHDGSVYSLSKSIIEYANKEQYTNLDNDIKGSYKRLYQAFSSFKEELFYENKLLNKEVLYFLERVKSESQILSGCINYLSNPDKFTSPKILESRLSVTAYRNFDTDVYFTTRDTWDGFQDIYSDVPIVTPNEIKDEWIYIEDKYLEFILESMPINDYYMWVYKVLEKEQEIVTLEAYLELSGILYALIIEYEKKGQKLKISYLKNKQNIYFDEKILTVPKMTIEESQ